MKVAFTILGEPVSMKNSRRFVVIGGKPRFIKSKEALDYERMALLQIPASAKLMLEGPLSITVRLFYASWRKDVDAELIYDVLAAKWQRTKGRLHEVRPGEYAREEGERVLVRKGVFLNDRQLRVKLAYGERLDRANPRAEIQVETLQAQQAELLAPELIECSENDDPF